MSRSSGDAQLGRTKATALLSQCDNPPSPSLEGPEVSVIAHRSGDSWVVPARLVSQAHERTILLRVPSIGPAKDEGPVALEVDLPVLENPRLDVVIPRDARELIPLALPSTGTLEVCVDDPLQRPEGSVLAVVVDILAEDAMDCAGPVRKAGKPRLLHSLSCTIPHVEIGLKLRVTVDRLDATEPASVIVHGPAREGESVLVKIRLEDRRPRLEGRVLDSDGTPVGRALLPARIVCARMSAPPADRMLVTNDDGVFFLEVDRSLGAHLSEGFSITIRSARREGVVTCPRSDRLSTTEAIQLGDVVLSRPSCTMTQAPRN